MKTIFITIPWFQPAYKAGGPIQSIVNLVTRFTIDVQYKIFCSNTDLNNEPLANITTGKWIAFNENTEVWYATTQKRSDTLLAQVNAIKPDLLYIIGIYNWHFNIVPLAFCKAPVKIISVRGMLHPGALAEKGLKKQLFLKALKIAGLHKKVLFHATDDTESTFIQNVFGTKVEIDIAGNFPRTFLPKPVNTKKAGYLKLTSIALISPMKNYLMVLEALKNVTGNIEYKIYGPVKDMHYWQTCLAVIETMPENIKVTYEGDLKPQLVENALKSADVFILPSKSENFGHSIIEALSAGLPVITSHGTPWNELQKENAGINVDTTIDAIRDALQFFVDMETDTYQSFSEGATKYAGQKIDVEHLRSQYKKLFKL